MYTTSFSPNADSIRFPKTPSPPRHSATPSRHHHTAHIASIDKQPYRAYGSVFPFDFNSESKFGAGAPHLVEETFGTDRAQSSSRGNDLANRCKNTVQDSHGNDRGSIPSPLAHRCLGAPSSVRHNPDDIHSILTRTRSHQLQDQEMWSHRDKNVCHVPFTLFFSTSNYASSHLLVRQPVAGRCGEPMRPMTAALRTPSATAKEHLSAHA